MRVKTGRSWSPPDDGRRIGIGDVMSFPRCGPSDPSGGRHSVHRIPDEEVYARPDRDITLHEALANPGSQGVE